MSEFTFSSMVPVFKEMHPVCEINNQFVSQIREEGHVLEGASGTNKKGAWVGVICKVCGIEEMFQR